MSSVAMFRLSLSVGALPTIRQQTVRKISHPKHNMFTNAPSTDEGWETSQLKAHAQHQGTCCRCNQSQFTPTQLFHYHHR
jgi:hypothetical protein